jgi:peptidyl-prolyl cis-trans isomerase A (cyclophilin A)
MARRHDPADRPVVSPTRGRLTFAVGRLASSRTTQVFINLGDNQRLDIDGFAPFGEIASSMVMVDRIFSGYGEGADQQRIMEEGNSFLMKYLPRLDYIKSAVVAK